MKSITLCLPDDLESRLQAEAQRRGTTIDLLAAECLEQSLSHVPACVGPEAGDTLFDFLHGKVSTIDGASEPAAANSEKGFLEGLLEKQRKGRL